VAGDSLYQTLRTRWRGVRRFLHSVPHWGTQRLCPICGWGSRRFRQFRHHRNPEAMCVHCGALERHRFVWLYFHARTDLFDGRPKRVLHVAPEVCFIERMKKRLADITAIPFPEATFDAIYCSHVLEHVPDDRRAMREFYRVLKPGGWAILLVPITVAGATFEDPTVVDPVERLRLFGQEDHVRRYGPDYVERLREAGFTVSATNVPDMFSDEEARRMGITHSAGAIFHCQKA
jgi:SAM-dependent methyltransferase